MNKENEQIKKEDKSGYITLENCKITKEGVYEYLGETLDPEGLNFKSDERVPVYRPAEELRKKECIESFNLLPFTIGHAMLGNPEKVAGVIDPEDKGFHGVTGQDIYFDEKDNSLKGTVKYFTKKLRDYVKNGIRDLSLGYFLKYEIKDGEFNGKPYKAIQRNIVGNHLALVSEGRTGKDVAVFDHFDFKIDDDGVLKMAENTAQKDKEMIKDSNLELKDNNEGQKIKDEIPLEEKVFAAIEKISERLSKLEKAEKVEAETVLSKDVEDPSKKVSEISKDSESGETKEKIGEQSLKDKEDKEAMDVNELSRKIQASFNKKENLVKKLVPHLGVFDHSEKTYEDILDYAAEKLNIDCKKNQKESALAGFFARDSMSQNYINNPRLSMSAIDGDQKNSDSVKKLIESL